MCAHRFASYLRRQLALLKTRLLIGIALAASIAAPSAAAHRVVSVGYRTPSALHGLRVVRRMDALRVAEVRVADPGVASRLRKRAGVRFVESVVSRHRSGGPIPLASLVSVSEWQWAASHADLVPLWVQQAASRVTIAVVDTGADLAVPSLAAKSPTPWNVLTASSAVSDQVGHGTFVASLAAGSVTSPNGMAGFGGEARLMIVQANRRGTDFTDVDEANGIVWAVDHGANIVNLSLGGTQTSQLERAAVAYAIGKGVLLVAAAGNAAQLGNPVMYPGALIGRSGLVVGAADQAGHRAPFSTTGSYVDLLAPGVDVLGAIARGTPGDLFTLASTPGADGAYGYGSGTSYAAPEAAGAAALVMAANPSLGAAGVARLIDASASGNGRWTNDIAYGNLNVGTAVAHAVAGTMPALVEPATVAKAPKARASAKKR
jgi:subtilisin family serine protease